MEDVHGLALDLLDRINGELRLDPSMNGLFARLYDTEGELMGIETNPLWLVWALQTGTRMTDLLDEEAGGAVPVDLEDLDRIELYRG